MIITVTMNPALDKTADIAAIALGGLNRLTDVCVDAGGKGINVSKMIRALGGESKAMGFLGGGAGLEIKAILDKLGIQTDFIEVSRTTRTNLKVLSAEHGITEFNEPGESVAPEALQALSEKLLEYAKPGTTFVFSGSVPGGVNIDMYGRLIGAVKAKGAAAFLDADGEVFGAALAAKPDYIKPNKFELAQFFGQTSTLSLTECETLCRQLVARGIRLVILSMGSEGAMFVMQEETLFAPGLKVEAQSTVGAGDSMVGALVYAFDRGMNLKDAAALAVAASAGAVTTKGTKPPDRKLVDELLERVKFAEIK